MDDTVKTFRWIRWTIAITMILFIVLLISWTRSANQRFDVAMSRVEKTGAARSLNELYERQTIDREGMQFELEKLAPVLSLQAELPLIEAHQDDDVELFDGNKLTDQGKALMEGILSSNSDSVSDSLALSRRKHFWAHSRFETLENARDEQTLVPRAQARTVASFLEMVAWYELSNSNHDSAMESALGSLRIANRMADQPVLELITTVFGLKQAALMQIELIVQSGPVDRELLKEAVAVIEETDVASMWQDMLETERALRLTDYHETQSSLWFNTNSAAEMLEIIEAAQLPPSGEGLPAMWQVQTPGGSQAPDGNRVLFQRLNHLTRQFSQIQMLEHTVKATAEEQLSDPATRSSDRSR